MRCPTLKELPPPPPDKTGWPWAEESPQLPDTMPEGRPWPRISIVTPNYNYGQFIEETIRSVLLQGYPNLEYIIIDGGSTDNSVEIIKKYEPWLTYWVSEPDRGQSHAINKGFDKSTGRIMAWLNSDDIYLPYCLSVVAEVFSKFDSIKWITTGFPVIMDAEGRTYGYSRVKYSREALLKGAHGGNAFTHRRYIQQESTFWLRDLWENVGGFVDERYTMAFDFELWLRFALVEQIYSVHAPLAAFRAHHSQKTRRGTYQAEAEQVLRDKGISLPSKVKWRLLGLLRAIPLLNRRFLWKELAVRYDARTKDWFLNQIAYR